MADVVGGWGRACGGWDGAERMRVVRMADSIAAATARAGKPTSSSRPVLGPGEAWPDSDAGARMASDSAERRDWWLVMAVLPL